MKKPAKILVSAAIIASIGCSVTGMTGCLEEENTLKIGYTIYAPMNYYDDNNKFVGFDTEFAKKVCADLGYKAEFIEIVWEDKIISLASGEIDCIWNGMTITKELQDAILISDAYMENKQVIVVKKEDAEKYQTLEDLESAPKQIVCEEGSAADTILSQSTISKSKILKAEKQTDALLEVFTGSSSAAMIDITMAISMTGEGTDYANLTYIDIGCDSEEYGIGFRKEDSKLCNSVNELIAKYKTDGTFTELYNKYMG